MSYRTTIVCWIASLLAAFAAGLLLGPPVKARLTSRSGGDEEAALTDEVSAVTVAYARRLQVELEEAPDEAARRAAYDRWQRDHDQAVRAIYRRHGRPAPAGLE